VSLRDVRGWTRRASVRGAAGCQALRHAGEERGDDNDDGGLPQRKPLASRAAGIAPQHASMRRRECGNGVFGARHGDRVGQVEPTRLALLASRPRQSTHYSSLPPIPRTCRSLKFGSGPRTAVHTSQPSLAASASMAMITSAGWSVRTPAVVPLAPEEQRTWGPSAAARELQRVGIDGGRCFCLDPVPARGRDEPEGRVYLYLRPVERFHGAAVAEAEDPCALLVWDSHLRRMSRSNRPGVFNTCEGPEMQWAACCARSPAGVLKVNRHE
jgi:hypothetical protein